MIEKELSERINNEVDKLFDDQIRFTQKLTRFPSLRGQEHTAQDFLFDELTKRDYALDRWTVNVEDIKDHPCLLYTSPSPRDRISSRMPSSA